ncbi:hypothetical protein [Pseudomonas sp. Irchel 3E20]|uniref:hypothetical protein n=1 Tax=Pseudomonas sp. Irchel 3E20 TaxID=2008983 RepID=UPI000BA3F67B|nr:hypothetical protein [Pseudomonas sp. Irchel 3E20]
MSNVMGIASAFALSSLFLSPLVMAEESVAFVAKNAARAEAYEKSRAELTAKARDAEQPQHSATAPAQDPAHKDS